MTKKLFALIVLVGIGIILFFSGEKKPIWSQVEGGEPEPGIERPMLISNIALFRRLDEPRVTFYHAKHVAALEQEGCVSCHPQDEEGRFDFQFPKVRNEESKRSLMNSYHDSCLGCHNERAKANQKAGPLACGECHIPKETEEWIQPLTFDYYLHYQHEKAMEKKCELCHHIYDEEQKKLIYKEETESSCRDCHRQTDQDSRRAYRKVAHADCINCHMEKVKEGKDAGPSDCMKCHFELQERTVEELAEGPRPDRKQPETVLIEIEGAGLKKVPFDHKGHELNTRSCRTCHHETLQACKNCHTLTGSEEGEGITLEKAYHIQTSEWSCNGCHEMQKSDEACAGCHLLTHRDVMSERTCLVCHSGPVDESRVVLELGSPKALLPEDVPEEMIIDVLQQEYEPSKFPHLKIIKKLTELSNNKDLSKRFHHDQTTMCSGCHHYSPVEPQSHSPKCVNCHKVSFDLEDHTKPRLLAVYHLQCLGCHEKMNLKRECTDCHAEKPKSSPRNESSEPDHH